MCTTKSKIDHTLLEDIGKKNSCFPRLLVQGLMQISSRATLLNMANVNTKMKIVNESSSPCTFVYI